MATGVDGNIEKLVYRIQESGPPLLKQILERRGWSKFDEKSTYWNLYWKGSRYKLSEYENCQPFQRINHFPSTALITRKDSLFRLLKTMKGIYGQVYNFFPITFTVPNEFIRFVRYKQQEDEQHEKSTWICKPVDLSRGRGIFVFRDLHELAYNSSAVVQKYINNPLLISGYKFDIRCYVLVRSFKELTVYFYDEGLTRFATSLYSLDSLDDKFSHLTNTSINKFSPYLNNSKDEVGAGCKWTINQLREYLQQKGIDFQKIWDKIKSIVLLTLLPLAPEVKEHSSSCFELYGFDILIDDKLKPWLLEVNMSPALSVDSQIDIDVKQALLEDMIDLIGFAEGTNGKYSFIQEEMDLWFCCLTIEGKPSLTAKKQKRVVYPEKVGKFNRIFPTDTLKAPSNLKVGDAEMKNLIQVIKKQLL